MLLLLNLGMGFLGVINRACVDCEGQKTAHDEDRTERIRITHLIPTPSLHPALPLTPLPPPSAPDPGLSLRSWFIIEILVYLEIL